MYESEIIKKFEKLPVFSLGDVNQIIPNRIYAKKFLKKMCKANKIFRVHKNIYTLYEDSFLISTFLTKPSYISGASALSYHHLITQIPNEVFCATMKKNKTIRYKEQINFNHTKYFFGFDFKEYEKFKIPIATPEKAIIDSLSIIPISVFEEAFEDINKELMLEILKKIKKSNIIKRIGYLMEKNGHDVYNDLKKYINYKYIKLEPLMKKMGKKDKKWGLIINTK